MSMMMACRSKTCNGKRTLHYTYVTGGDPETGDVDVEVECSECATTT